MLAEPPSFQSQEDESKVLQLDPSKRQPRDLYTKLSGSEVTITRKNGVKVSGTLTGTCKEYTEQVGTTAVERYKVTVLSSGKIISISEDDIEDATFTQEAIQQAVTKALARNFNKINPDSTVVEFSVSPLPDPDSDDSSAIYQFAVPFCCLAAGLPVASEGREARKLEASAKIDNPTDEDLKDTVFSVATGNPRCFETDLAEIRQPKRQRINIVADTAEGAEQMQDGLPQWNTEEYNDVTCDSEPGGLEGVSARGGMRAKSAAHHLSGPVAACAFGGPAGSPPPPRAVQDSASSQDVGDFAIYTSKAPLNLGRKRSATIPLFQIAAEGSVVLDLQGVQPQPSGACREIQEHDQVQLG